VEFNRPMPRLMKVYLGLLRETTNEALYKASTR
jgi:hypothetical protein